LALSPVQPGHDGDSPSRSSRSIEPRAAAKEARHRIDATGTHQFRVSTVTIKRGRRPTPTRIPGRAEPQTMHSAKHRGDYASRSSLPTRTSSPPPSRSPSASGASRRADRHGRRRQQRGEDQEPSPTLSEAASSCRHDGQQTEPRLKESDLAKGRCGSKQRGRPAVSAIGARAGAASRSAPPRADGVRVRSRARA